MLDTLGKSEKESLREVVLRMKNGERGLHTKTIGPLKLVRVGETMPKLLLQSVEQQEARGKLKLIREGGGIRIYETRQTVR